MGNSFNNPLVSIIITTYNGEKYIKATIESILAQTYTNWELIIIDDGSVDQTCAIVRSIADKRVNLHEAGRVGINGKVKNIGIGMAAGEYVAFIDHDDLWHCQKLEKQVATLHQYPDAGFSLCGGYNFTIEGEPLEYFYSEREGERYDQVFNSIFSSQVAVWTQALLVRRSCLDTTGLFLEDSVFADPEFIYRLAFHFKGVISYEPLMYHRVHETNYTKLNWIKTHTDGMALIESYRAQGMLAGNLAKRVLFHSRIHFGDKCKTMGRRQMAITSYAKAWKHRPLSIIPLKRIVRTLLLR